MKKTIAILLAVALVAVLLVVFLRNSASAPQPSGQPTGSSSAPTENQQNQETESDTEPLATTKVEIADFAYSPKVITVKKGSTVTWTNQDSMRHDITPDEESDDFKASDLLAKGDSYSFTFEKPGTYTYHCSPHPYMKGTVIVTE